jgi:hypothetical protein
MALQLVLEEQFVLKNHSSAASSTMHLPSLLRSTISLTSAVLDGSKDTEGSPEAEANVEKLCKFFEGGKHSFYFQESRLTPDSRH